MSPGPRPWIDALRASHARLAGLAGPMGAGQLAQPSYASDWTVAGVLSHLGSGAEISQLMLTAALDGGTADPSAFAPIWQEWDAKSPQRQAADCLAADAAHIARLDGLAGPDLARMRLQFFGMDLDAAGIVQLRLSEHALHTWDVAVALDPGAVVAADAVALLAPHAPFVARLAGRPAGRAFAVRLRAADLPEADFLLQAGESVAMTPWPGQGGDGEIALPAEALLRLVYGRLDPGHTPHAQVSGDVDLALVRAVFPGF